MREFKICLDSVEYNEGALGEVTNFDGMDGSPFISYLEDFLAYRAKDRKFRDLTPYIFGLDINLWPGTRIIWRNDKNEACYDEWVRARQLGF